MSRRSAGTGGRPRPRRPVPAELPLAEQVDAAREAALRLLSVRERSRSELQTKLRTKGYSPEAVARVLDRLAETGLQDDVRFANLYAESARNRGFAGGRVRNDLRRKGVETLTSIEASTERPEEELERARALVARRASSLSALAPEVRKRRLTGFLARRGYGHAVISQVLGDIED